MSRIKVFPGNRTPYFAESLSTAAKIIERWVQILKKEEKIEFKGSAKTGGYYVI